MGRLEEEIRYLEMEVMEIDDEKLSDILFRIVRILKEISNCR